MEKIALESGKLLLAEADVLDKCHLGYLVVTNKKCTVYENVCIFLKKHNTWKYNYYSCICLELTNTFFASTKQLMLSNTTLLALSPSSPFSAAVPNLDMVEGVDNEKVSSENQTYVPSMT